MRLKSFKIIAISALTVSALLSILSQSYAATLTWDANGATALQSDGAGVWLTANQWWDGSANVTWTSGDDAIFGNGGAGGAVTLDSGTTVNSLTFSSFTGTYTIGTAGSTITLNNGITMNSGAGAATIISPITLGAAQSWTNNSSSLLTVGTGAVTNGGFLLTVGGTGNTTVSSVIGGLGGLTKTGTGLLTLSGANTFAGQLTVQNGTLSINTINNESANGTLGNSASSVILGNTGAQTGTLQYTGATASSTKKFTLATGGTGAFEVTTGANTLSLTGLIDGGGGLTKTGAGTLTLSNTNTYTGATTVNAGTLKLDFSAAGAPTTNIISSSSALTLGGGTTLNGTTLNLTGKASTTNSQAFNGTTINPGVSAITLTANATANPLSLNLGAITRNVGSVLRITLPTGTRSATNGVLTTSGTAGQILLSNGVAYATIGLSDWAGMDATNTFLAPVTYTAATATSLSGNASLNAMMGTTTLSSNTTITSLRAAMGRTYTLNINAGVTLTTGGILVGAGGPGSGIDDAGIFLINGPGSLRGPAGQDLVFINHPVGITRVHPTTISAPIVDNVSATGFTYSGLGGAGSSATGEPLSLTGTNTYTGTTRILGGTFSIGNGGTTGSLDPSSQIVNNASLIINRSNDLTFSNSISGTGTLTKSGAGRLTLTGTNTYSGGTTVSAGALLLSGAFNMPSTGTLAVSSGGVFSLADGTARATNGATTGVGLTLAAGSSLGFDWIGGSLDSFTTLGTATSTGNVLIDIRSVTPSGTGGTLINAAAGSTLNAATYLLANNTNFTATISSTPTTVSIGAQTPATALTDAYWKGGQVTGFLGTMTVSTGTVSNWATDVAGTATGLTPGSTANMIFSATGATQQASVITGVSDMSVNSITFNDLLSVTIAGSPNVITLNSTSGTAASTLGAGLAVTPGSAISVTSFANATNTISANLALGANQTWNVASGKTLVVSGIVSGTGSLTKADAGTVTLSGANSYTGGTNLNGGTLNLSSTGALGSGGITLNGGILSLRVTDAVLGNVTASTASTTIYQQGAFTNSGTSTLTFTNAGANTFNVLPGPLAAMGSVSSLVFGATTLSGDTTFNLVNAGPGGTTSLTLGALSAATRTITKEGAGALTINANATTGPAALIINRGSVTTNTATALGSAAAVTVNNNATWTENTNAQTITSLAGAGTATLTSNLTIAPAAATTTTFSGLTTLTGITEINGSSTGVQVFSGPTGASAGGFKITSGTLRALDLTTTLGTGAVNLNGGTLDLRANTTQTFGVGTTTVNATSTINVQNNATASNNVLSIGALTFTGATGLNVTGANGYWLNTTGAVTLTNANQAIDVASGMTFQMGAAVGGAAFGINKTNTGTLILASANSYTGATTLSAGTLRGLVAASFGGAGTGLNLNGGILELFAQTNAATTYANTNTTVGNSSSTTITADILTGMTGISGFGNGYSNAQPVGTPTITHILGTLALGTSSTLTVNSQNYDGVGVTFGATTINGTLASPSAINVGATAAQYSQLTLGALTMGATNVLDVNTAGSGTLLLGTPSTTVNNAAVINVNGGTLRIGNATALGTAAGTGAVNVNTGATLEIAGVVPTSGNITLNTGAILRGTGASGFNNATANTFNIASGATGVTIQTGTSSIGFNSAATGDIFTITKGIGFGASPAAVTVSGNGRVILNGNATNNGTWTHTNGILQLGSATALGATSSASIAVNGGILATSNALTVGTPITLGGGALAGSATASTVATYNGGVALTGGTTSTIYAFNPTLNAVNNVVIGGAAGIGPVTGATGNLLISGLAAATNLQTPTGTVSFTGIGNTYGTTTITNAIMNIGGISGAAGAGSGTFTGTGAFTLNQSGVLTIDNSQGSNNSTRMSAANFTSTGGSINLLSFNAATALSQTIGTLALSGGDTTINVTRGASTLNADLTITNAPTRSNGAVINYIGTTGTLGTAGNNPHILFSTGTPTLNDNLIGGWATVGGSDFATYGADGVAATTYSATLITGSTAATDNINVSLAPVDTVTSRTLNSLKIGAITIQMRTAGDALTLDTGGLLFAGAGTISGGSITSSGTELFIHTPAAGIINSQITGAGVSLIKAGSGALTFGSASIGGSPANTFDGTTYVNQGSLTLQRAPGVNAVSGSALIVQAGNVALTNAEQIADAANVTLNNLNGFATNALATAGTAGLNETINSLTLVSTTANGVSGTGTLILANNAGDALTVTGGTIAAPLRFTGTSNGGIAFVAPTTALAPTAATLGGPYQTTISGVVDLNSTSTALTRTINVANGPALIDLNITGALTASGNATGITKTGAGTMRIGVASTYTGLTTVNGGVLSFNVANALGLGGLTVTSGTAQFDVTAAANTLPIATTLPTVSPLTVTVNGGTLEFNNVASTTFGKLIYTGGTINAPTTGLLTLQNPNNNADILSLDGTTNAVSLRGNLNLGAAVVVNNVITSAGSTNMVSLDGVLALGSGPRNFVIADGSNAVDLDVTSSITGAAILIKSGAGTMRLSGGLATQNVNSGPVYVTAGTLALNKSGVFGTTGGVAVGTGALIIGGTTGTTAAVVRLDQDEQINNANAITINAGGTLNLGAFSETIGAVSINSSGSTGGSITGTTGTLYLSGNVAMTGGSIGLSSGTTIITGAPTLTFTSNATLAATLTGNINLGTAARIFTVNPGLGSATSDLTVSGIISGNNIGLTKAGVGIMTLSGTNTYTGLTTLSAGSLVLTSTGSLSANSAVSIGGTMTGTVNPTLDITAGDKTIGSLTGGAAAAPFVAGIVNIGTRTLTVGSDETSPAAFAGAITGSSGGLTKIGTGTLTLSNVNFSNAWTGATAVNAGILSITGANALPMTTDVSVSSGGTLFLTSVAQTVKSLAVASGGSVNILGAAGTNLTIGAGTTGDTILAGTIDGSNSAAALIKVGTGKLSITGNQNTFLGAVTVNQGTLVFSGNGTLPTTAAYTINNGGKLQLDNTGTNNTDRLAATAPMTLSGGTFEVLGKNTASSGEQLAQLTLNTGASTINVVNGTGAGSSMVVTFNSAINRTNGTLNITSSGGTLGYAPRVMFLGTGTNTVLPGVIVGGNSMAFYNDVLGARALTLGEQNALNVTTDQSIANFGIKFISTTANQILPAARSINALTIDSPGASKSIDIVGADASTNTLTVTTGNIILNGTDNFEFKRTSALPVLTAASGSITSANPLTFWVTTAATTLTVSAPISGATVVNKSGAGTLTLSGANLYTGSTILNEGTLKMGASNSLYSMTPAGVQTGRGALSINNPAAAFDIGGFNNIIGALNVISGSITNTGAGGSLTTTGALTLGTSTAVGGAYGSAPSISIGGSGGTGILNLGGDVTFNANNDPNGATIAGNLALGYDFIGAGMGRTSSGATRFFIVNDSVAAGATGNANPDLTVSAVVSGAGLSLAKAGTGVMLLSGTNTYSGPTAISAGQLNVSNAAALGNNSTQRLVSVGATSTLGVSGGLSFNANTVLSLNGTGRAVTESGDLAFPGALNNIADSNSFAGMVTLPVAAGATIKNSASSTTLTLSGDIIQGVIAAPAITVMGAGNVTFSGAINTGTGTLIYNSTNATPTNATLTLSGTANNYYTGATTINAGSVVLNKTTNGTNAIGIGALTVGLAGGGPAATLSYGTGTAGNDQINDYTAITLNQSGTINMNGVSDTVGSLASAAIYGAIVAIPGSPTANLVGGIPLVNGSVNLGTGGATLTIGANNTSTSFGGVISGTGASNLVKIGIGVQTLTNASTYTGSTTITHGGITLGYNNALPTTTALTVNSPTALAATTGGFYLAGFSQTVASLSGNGTIALGTSTGGYLTFGDSNNTSFDGIIGGTLLSTEGGLIKQGSGTFTLTGANTFTTNLKINQGTVVAKDISASLGAAAPIWLNASNSGTTLSLLANTTQAMGASAPINITGSGNAVTINVNNNGGTASGNVFTLGTLNMGGQTLAITGGNNYGVRFTGAITLTPDTTSTFNVGTGLSLELNGATALTSGAIAKTGAGLMILTGVNANTGNLTITTGTLRAIGNAATSTVLPNATGPGAVTLNGGTLDLRTFGLANTAWARNIAVSADSTINSDVTVGLTGFPSTGTLQPIAPTVFNTFTNLSLGANILSVTGTTGVGVQSLGLTTLTGTPTFNVAAGQMLQLNQVAESGGSYGINLTTGTGIVNIIGANGTTGASTISAGILRASNVLALGLGATTVGAAGTIEINNVAMTSGTIVLNATGATLRGVGASAGFTGLGNPISITAGQSVTIQTGTSTMGSTAFNTADVFTIGTAQYGPLAGTTVGGLTGGASSAVINVSGQGKVILAASSSTLDSTASWNLTSGVLQLGAATTNPNALGTANAITISGSATGNGTLASGAIATTYTNPITLSGGAIAGATAAVLPTYASGTTVTLTGGTTSMLYAQDASLAVATTRTLDIAGQITGSGNLSVAGLAAATFGPVGFTSNANDFTGDLAVTNAILTFGKSSGTSTGKWQPSNTPTLTLNQGGQLTIENAVANVADRIKDDIAIGMTGGTITLTNLSGNGAAETVGNVTLNGGLNSFVTTHAGAAAAHDLTLTSLTRNAGATAIFTGTTLGTTATSSRIFITGQGVVSNLGGGYITGNDFVQYTAANGLSAITAYTANPLEAGLTTGLDVRYTTGGTTTLTDNRATNSIVAITTAPTLATNGNTLTLESGGFISGITASSITGTAAGGITAGTTASAAELFIHNNAAALTLNAIVKDNLAGGSVSLVFDGSVGTNITTLTGSANTYTGTTYVNSGTVTLSKTAGTNAIPGDLIINGGTVNYGATTFNEEIANTSNVTINNLNGSGVLTLSATAGQNETINSIKINATSQAGVSGTGTLILAGSDGSNNAITMTGGAITAPVTLSSTTNGNIKYTAPATVLLPTTYINGVGGPYQSLISGAFNINSTATTGITRAINIEDGPSMVDMVISSVISNTTATGLTKTGAGTLQFSGGASNTYSGLTTVSAGTLSLAKTGTFNAIGAGGLLISGTGVVNYDVAGTDEIANGATVTVAGGTLNFNNIADTIGALVFNSGTVNAPLSTTLTLANTGVNALTLGTASGGAAVTLTGNLALTGASGTASVLSNDSSSTNTLAGAFSLGTVAREFTVSNGAAAIDLDVTAVLSGAGGGITKLGAGTMRLSGDILSNNSFTGTTTVNAGTLALAKTGGYMSAANGGVAILGALTIGDNTGGANADVVRLDVSEQIINTATVTVNSSGLFNMNGNSETIAALNIGTTAANGGSVTNGGGSAGSTLYTTGAITMNGGTINLNGSGTGGKLVLTGGAITTTAGGAAGANAITANSILLPTALAVTLNNAADVLTINGNISGYGIGLTKTGVSGSILVLNGSNTFTGATTITQGTLRLAGGNAISDDSAVTLADTSGVIFDLNGTTETIGSLANVTGTNAIVSLGAGGALTTGADDSTTTFAGRITGTSTSTLTKVGIGTMTLSGALANTYTGLTTVTAGGLTLTKTAGVNAIAGNLTIGPASGTGTQTVVLGANNQIADTSLVTVNATGIFNMNAFAETIANIAGSGLITNTGTAQTLTLAPSTGSQTFSGIINASTPANLALTVSATGTSSLTLSGTQTNNFTGTTTVGSSSGTFTLIVGKTGDTISTLPGNIAINSGGKVQFGASSGTNQLSNAFINNTQYPTNTITLAGTGILDLNGVSAVINSLTGTLTGTTLINSAVGAATLNLAGAAPVLTLNNTTAQLTNINLAWTNPLNLAGGITTTGAGATLSIASNIDLNTTAATGATRTFTIADGASAVDVNLTGILSSSGGPTGFTKLGAGTLRLSGTNTYTGGTVVNAAGTLQAGSTQAFGLTSAVNMSLTGGVLDLNNLNNTIGSLTGVAGSSVTLGTATLTVGSDNTTPAAFAGIISGGIGGGLTKIGTGNLTLSGSNTFTGGVTISGGVLQLGSINALNPTVGSQNAVTFGAATTGTLVLAGNSVTIANLNGSASGPVVTNANGSLVAAATLTVGNSTNASGTYAGILQNGLAGGTLALTKAGTGTLTLSGSNTFTGGVTISGGTLQLGSTTALNPTVGSENAVTFGAATTGTLALVGNSVTIANLNASAIGPVVTNANGSSVSNATLTVGNSTNATGSYIGILQNGAGGGTLALTKAGTGTLTLSGSNSYTGATTVNAGTLKLDFSVSGAPITNINSSSSALVLGGGTLNLTGKASTTNSQAVNGTTLNLGLSAITLTANVTANPLSLNLGAITRSAGSVLRITLPTGTASATNGVRTSSGTASTILLSSGVAYATIGTTDWAGMDATNTFIVPVTYTAATDTSLSGNATRPNGTTTLSSNTTITSLRMTGASSSNVTINAGSTLTTGGILMSSDIINRGTASTISGPGSLRGPAGQDLVVLQYQGNFDNFPLFISAPIVDNGSSGLTYFASNAANALTLTGSNTYTGVTRILGGGLVIGNGGTTGSLDPSSQIVNSGSLTINRSDNLTFSNSISGTGTLTKSGAGAMLLSGNNTYSGWTMVSGGTLQIGADNALGSSILYPNGGAIEAAGTSRTITTEVLMTGSSSVVGSQDLTFASNFIQASGASLTLTNNLVAGKKLTINGNVGIQYQNNNEQTLTFSGTGDTVINGFIYKVHTRTGSLSKSGTGTLTLSGASANTYDGLTTVSGGTLVVAKTTGTPFGTGAVTLNAGTLSLAPTGSGSAISLTGGTGAASTNFTFNPDATLSLARGSQTSLTFTFGSSGAGTAFARGANGTLILSTSDIANFGTLGTKTERFIINSGSTAPTQVNTLVSGVVIQDRNTSNAGDFAAYNGTDGFTKATYTLTDSFASSANTDRVNITTGISTPTTTTLAYALKVGAVTVTNTGTITLGTTGNPAALILNGGTISGNTLAAAAASEFVIYTSGTSAISSAITTSTSGMSVFGLGTLTLSNTNTFTGGLRINNSTVIATNDNQLGGTLDAITLTGGTLQTSGTFGLGGAGQRAIVLAAGQDQLGGTFNVTSDTTSYQNSSTSSKILSGTGSLTKIGAGTLALTGNTTNTYTGGTFANVGTLQLGAANMLPDAGLVTVNGGTFDIQTFSDTVGAVTLTSGTISGTSGVLTGTYYDVRSGTASAALAGTGATMTKTTSGTVTLSGTNTYTGITTISAGTLQFAKTVSLPSSTAALLNVNNGGTLAFNVGGTGEFTTGNVTTLLTNLAASSSSTNGMNAGSSFGFDTTNASGGTFTIADVIANSTGTSGGARGLTKLGTGTLILNNTNTYTGATTINGGILSVGTLATPTGSINSSALTINGGNFRNNSATNYTGALTFTSGTISGTNWGGSLSNLTIGTGQIISPGNSPGTATVTGDQTWASAGSYTWEINSTSGTAGVDPGWDLINGSGTLSVTALAELGFNINVTSLTTGNASGAVSDFDQSLSYNWLIADFAAVSGFSSDKFTINTSSFTNAFTGNFAVALGNSGTIGGDNSQIWLTYTAIPEPKTALLGVLGVLLLLRRRRN
jgi:autotransporter-associated beta strand protein